MSRKSLALLAIVIVGVGIRITYTVTTGDSLRLFLLDGEIAHNIVADGRWFVRNTQADAYLEALSKSRGRLIDPASVDLSAIEARGQWFPEVDESVGGGVVLAGLWAITGRERYIQVQILQGVLDGFATLLVYWIAMQLFKRTRPAIIAAALYAVYPPIAWQTAEPYNDIWAVEFTIAIVAIYLVILKSRHRWRWLVVCGLCAGIGAYFRPQVLLIAPALAIATSATTGWREALRRALAPTLVAALLLVPWAIRNYIDFHAFIPTRAGFWVTAWAGLAEIPNNFGGHFTGQAIAAEIHRVRPDLVYETPAWDSYIKHYVIQAIEQHPLFYLEVLAHRVVLATVWEHQNAWMHRGAGAVFGYRGGLLAFIVDHPFEVIEYALQPVVFLLAMLSLGFTWRRWKQQQMILVAAIVCVLLPYMLVHVEGRYLLPAAFIYFIWIGFGAELLVERLVGGRFAQSVVGSRRRRAPTMSLRISRRSRGSRPIR